MDDIKERLTMTTQEVADTLYVNVRRVTDFRKAGLLQGFKTGKRYVYPVSSVERCLALCIGQDLTNREKVFAYGKWLKKLGKI